jgi:hypothetical protein
MKEVDKMGLESYNFLLFPKANKVELTEEGWETSGDSSIPFEKTREAITLISNVAPYIPQDKWSTFDEDCYYSYVDDSSKIEVRISNWDLKERVDQISVRFAVCNPEGTFEKAIHLCREIALLLEMKVLDMKLHEILDFGNEMQLVKSKKKFEEKRLKFFATFDLPKGIIAKPLYCAEVFDVLKGKQ